MDALDVTGWTPAALLGESGEDLDWAWSVLIQNPKLALKAPLKQRKEVIDAGVYKWTASNYLSTTRLAQAFRTKLGVMIVTSAHARYKDTFVYGLMTFWGRTGRYSTWTATRLLRPLPSRTSWAGGKSNAQGPRRRGQQARS